MLSAYDFEPFHPDSTEWTSGTGYVPSAFAETKSGQHWRQFMKIPHSPPLGTEDVTYPTRIYRYYEDIERYALLPGSAWFVHHDSPYTRSEMQKAGAFPPNCPAGRRAPTILDSTMKTQTVWRSDLNDDQKVDRVLRENSVGETGPAQHEFTVYARCNGTWYTRIHRQRYAVELTPTDEYTTAPNGSRWRNLHVRFHEPGETEVRSRTIRFKHAAYEEGLP
ncbi:hypothetical protein BSZ35_12600 [Salinibacter sp. 10B]|uniref:hypothetical protein n=1 Tax=Salinibacter sp. 10B TaxID=1923971 RepID=UPI000CF4326B|nr:hypothetical protein [Salinibacter sp. 10B]PQJ35329.1 hypothetical protein BSZ35_12600 [Salinibacter sp. 10B]